MARTYGAGGPAGQITKAQRASRLHISQAHSVKARIYGRMGRSHETAQQHAADDQVLSIEVSLPDGGVRLLLFDGKGAFVTHVSAEADGSAALSSSARRERDWTIITVGKEVYRIPDVFVLGD